MKNISLRAKCYWD